MKYSPIRKLSPYAQAARDRGLRVLGLNIGQPDIETPPQFFEAMKNFDGKVLKYSESRGETVLLDSFIKYYKSIGIEFSHNNMIVTKAFTSHFMPSATQMMKSSFQNLSIPIIPHLPISPAVKSDRSQHMVKTGSIFHQKKNLKKSLMRKLKPF